LTYEENPLLLIVIDDIGAFHRAIEIVTPAAVAGPEGRPPYIHIYITSKVCHQTFIPSQHKGRP